MVHSAHQLFNPRNDELAVGVADERRSECIPPKVSDWYLEYYGPMSVKSPSKHIEGHLN